MVQRKDIPVKDDVHHRRRDRADADGGWAVVASIKHRSPSGEQSTDLPVDNLRYSDQREAEEAGIAQGRAWLSQNVPHAA